MLSCRLFGHKLGFTTKGRTMRWGCERCGQVIGSKDYPTEAEAQHYAAAFDRRDTDDLGRRAPLIGMFPLRVWRSLTNRSHDHQEPPTYQDP